MSDQESDPISKKEYLKLANECFLLKNRKNLLEDWIENVEDIQKIAEGEKKIAEIDTQLRLLEKKLENHAYTKTDGYARTNEHLQEIEDHADRQKLDAARQRALLRKEDDIRTAKFYENYKDYKGYTKIGGSKSRRRHRRHRKHARKTRHKRKHRSRIARKHKKYTRMR
jgi:hypothetical protein